ncbi:ribonuclease H-like domain-containing protein [Favolaschia claudopus]|uniref:Ribonuclease H-like domain-containing protein n=1 Tax=Favolaschia claudopus TaxID=2862362 RepID=A0AAW0D7D0_9AGAR
MNSATRLGLGIMTHAPSKLLQPFTHFQSPKARLQPGSHLEIYVDGSAGHAGGDVGAAARATIPDGTTIIMKQYLGKLRKFSSQDGEIFGAMLALRILKATEPLRFTHATIFTDSKWTIHRLLNDKARDGELVRRFDDEARRLKLTHLRGLQLQWVPAHRRVLGNELVDLDAKAAALGESSIVWLRRGV